MVILAVSYCPPFHYFLFKDALNQLLTDMVNETLSEDNRLDMDIASLAASCLTSLVLARGEPHRILSAIDGVLTGPEQLTEETLLVSFRLGLQLAYKIRFK